MSFEGFCGDCGAEIYWLATPAGKRMPVNRQQALRGNLKINLEQGTVAVLHKGESGGTHISHMVTCKYRGKYKR